MHRVHNCTSYPKLAARVHPIHLPSLRSDIHNCTDLVHVYLFSTGRGLSHFEMLVQTSNLGVHIPRSNHFRFTRVSLPPTVIIVTFRNSFAWPRVLSVTIIIVSNPSSRRDPAHFPRFSPVVVDRSAHPIEFPSRLLIRMNLERGEDSERMVLVSASAAFSTPSIHYILFY